MIYVWWLNTYLKYGPSNYRGKYGTRTGGFSVYSIYQSDIPKISFGLFKID